MDQIDREDHAALRSLADAYARSVDRRDADAFLAVFTDDGVLETPAGSRRGRAQLAEILDRIAVYARTFHLVGQATYDLDGDAATGEVYCMAHHWNEDGSGHVMYIRYHDRYRRDAGGWRISERRLLVDHTATATSPPGRTPG